MEFEVEYEYPKGFEKLIRTDILEAFSIKDCYIACIDKGLKGKDAIDLSIANHFEAIEASATDLDHALSLQQLLQDHIEHRIKHYTKCISKCTDNYFKYLLETYNRQLSQKIRLNIED
jgi:deoxyribose-phosphate aldolase